MDHRWLSPAKAAWITGGLSLLRPALDGGRLSWLVQGHQANRRTGMADCSSTAGIHLIVAKSVLAKNAGSPLRSYALT